MKIKRVGEFRSRLPIIFLILIFFSLPITSNAGLFGSDDHQKDKDSSASNINSVELLRNMQEGLIAISEKAIKGVVFISTVKEVPIQGPMGPLLWDFFGFGHGLPNHGGSMPFGKDPRGNRPPGGEGGQKFQQRGVGSGFIINLKEGHILTNNHVVGDADEISVKTQDGKEHKATVIGKDKNTDIAVIKVEGLSSSLTEIKLADFDKVRIGQWAIAVGAPMGLDQTVTRGIVSAKGRGSLDITGQGDFIQTDAAINPGNSGGPLIDIDGNAIGMNTAIYSKTGGNQGIGFAIPSNILKDISSKLIKDGKIKRAYLGVYIQNLDDEMAREFGLKDDQKGVLVAGVEHDSPADKAGIKEGDIITEVGGERVTTGDQLSYKIALSSPDTKVTLKFYRKGKLKTEKVKLTLRDDSKGPSEINRSDKGLGMSIETDPQGKGVRVVQVQPGMPADNSGIRSGDIIVEVNQHDIKNVSDFKKYDNDKEKVLLRIFRDGFYRYVRVTKK